MADTGKGAFRLFDLPVELTRMICEVAVGNVGAGVYIRIHDGDASSGIPYPWSSQRGEQQQQQYEKFNPSFKFPPEMSTRLFLVSKRMHKETVHILRSNRCTHVEVHIDDAVRMLKELALPLIVPARVSLGMTMVPKPGFRGYSKEGENEVLRIARSGGQWISMIVIAHYATLIKSIELTLWRGERGDMSYGSYLEDAMVRLDELAWAESSVKQREVNQVLAHALKSTTNGMTLDKWNGDCIAFESFLYLRKTFRDLLEDHLADIPKYRKMGRYLYNLEQCIPRISGHSEEGDEVELIRIARAGKTYRDFGIRACSHQKMVKAENDSGGYRL